MGENDKKENSISTDIGLKLGNYVLPPINKDPDGIPYAGKIQDSFVDGTLTGVFKNINIHAGAMVFNGDPKRYQTDYSFSAGAGIKLDNMIVQTFARHIHMPDTKADDRLALSGSVSQALGKQGQTVSIHATHIDFGNDNTYRDIGVFWQNIGSTTALNPVKLSLSTLSVRYINSDLKLPPFQRVEGEQWEVAAKGEAAIGKNLSVGLTGRYNTLTQDWGAMPEVRWKPNQSLSISGRANIYPENVQMALLSIAYAPSMKGKNGVFADIFQGTKMSLTFSPQVKYAPTTLEKDIYKGLVQASISKGFTLGNW